MFTCIIGPNLELRLHEDRYAQEMFDLADRNRDHIRPFLPWIEKTKTVEDIRKHIEESLKHFASGECINTGIWENNRFIGSIAFHRINKDRGLAEIGYWIDKDHQGRGITTRATA